MDTEIQLHLEKQFTSIVPLMKKVITDNELVNANIYLWIPHEVSSLVQIGWEDGLLEDLDNFLADTVPEGKWLNHNEPGTEFEHNFHEHIKTKLVGDVNKTLLVKDGELLLGKYQDLFFYSPVFEKIPDQKLFCRVMSV